MSDVRQQLLLVEDDEAIRQLLALLFEVEDAYDVVLAEDGAEALRLAQELRPSVVVLDLRLPRVDGLEVARRLKAHPATHACWIVGISAEVEESAALAAGCDRFLAKPLDIARLEEAVRPGLARAEAPPATV